MSAGMKETFIGFLISETIVIRIFCIQSELLKKPEQSILLIDLKKLILKINIKIKLI